MTDDAFSALFADLGAIKKENYRDVYTAVETMLDSYTFYALPLYDNASSIQLTFEENVNKVLSAAHNQYRKLVSEGEPPQTVLDALVEAALAELISLTRK